MKAKKGDIVSFSKSDVKPQPVKGIVLGSIMGMYDVLTREGHYSKTEREILSVGKNVFDEIEKD